MADNNNYGVQEFYLDNGLQILIKENHSAPIFTHLLMYKVGSRHDEEYKTGAAHYLEHMQFNGTKKRSKGQISTSIEERGGTFNALTSMDYTAYYMNLPSSSENLNFAMDLESDRMRNSIINQDEADREKQVVLEELARGENNPIQVLYKEVMSMTYPEHSYGDPIIGWKEDVINTQGEDLVKHYDRYYQPNNAVLVVVGDVNVQEVLDFAKKHYGHIARSNTGMPERALRNPRAISQDIVQVKRAGNTQAVMLAWDTVDYNHDDIHALQALSLILSHGDLSRFEKELVQTGKCNMIDAFIHKSYDSNIFGILAMTSDTKSINNIEEIILKELNKIKKLGITRDELNRVKAKIKTSFLYSLEQPYGLAMQLAKSQIIGGDWHDTFRQLDNINELQVFDIQKVAQKYLTADKLQKGYLAPSFPDKTIAQQSEVAIYHKGITATEYQLADKLNIIHRQDSNTANELIAIEVLVDAGNIFESIDNSDYMKYGMSSLTAMMLDKGTQKYSRLELAQELESIGAQLDINPQREYVEISGLVHKDYLNKYWALLSSVLTQPKFSQSELDQIKELIVMQLEQSRTDLGSLSKTKLTQAIYPENHPLYSKTIDEKLELLNLINIDDLNKFYDLYYQPERFIMSVSGNISQEEIQDLNIKYLSSWLDNSDSQSVNTYKFDIPVVKAQKAQDVIKFTIPDKTQAKILMGYPASIHRGHKDYYAYLIAIDILGGGSSLTSRLGSSIREEAGLVYSVHADSGARRAPQIFVINMGTTTDKVDQAIELTHKAVQDFVNNADNITDEELTRAKNYRKGAFIAYNLTSNSKIANSLSLYKLWGLDLNTINSYTDQVESVTKEDVVNAIKKYICPNCLQTVIALPENQ